MFQGIHTQLIGNTHIDVKTVDLLLNTTTFIQPMDQSTIAGFKVSYLSQNIYIGRQRD
jgi:hypothetical protein